jgi:hypothetical protein
MHARRFTLLFLVAIAFACNDESGGAPDDTCSAENIVDDVDDGVEVDATD